MLQQMEINTTPFENISWTLRSSLKVVHGSRMILPSIEPLPRKRSGLHPHGPLKGWPLNCWHLWH